MGRRQKSVIKVNQKGKLNGISNRKPGPENRKAMLNIKLFDASEKGDLQGIDDVLEKGADVNARNATGHTPLMMAVMRKKDDAIELLIGKGANVNAKNDNGKSVLWFADLEQSRILKKAGAKTPPAQEFSLCAGC